MCGAVSSRHTSLLCRHMLKNYQHKYHFQYTFVCVLKALPIIPQCHEHKNSHPYMTQHGSQITYLFLVPSHIIPTNSAAYTYCGTYRYFAYQTIRYKHGQLRTGLLARFVAQTQHSLQGRAKRALSLATGQT